MSTNRLDSCSSTSVNSRTTRTPTRNYCRRRSRTAHRIPKMHMLSPRKDIVRRCTREPWTIAAYQSYGTENYRKIIIISIRHRNRLIWSTSYEVLHPFTAPSFHLILCVPKKLFPIAFYSSNVPCVVFLF